MNKQIFYILIAFVFFSLNSNAQSLTTSVLSTGGGSVSADGVQLGWTVGQPFLPMSLSTGNTILTQGFQQPELQVWTGLVNNQLYKGVPITIPFKASGIISDYNVYTAELSDKNGDFNNPTRIGTSRGNENGLVTGTIPSDAVVGSEYRIRIKSSESPFEGTDNGYPLTIKQQFVVNVSPNPSRTSFGLSTEGTSGEKIQITVMDAFGRTIEIINGGFVKGGFLQLGANYRPGVYMVQIIQGNEKVVLTLVKLSS
ncbi:MAG: T9SS type A sorting domain-containing protein [Chitinophagaceae bacterium]